MPTPTSKLSNFILSLPSTLSGSQVVERAKAKGMKTSRANVSRVRGLHGPKAVKTSTIVTSATSKTVAAKPTGGPAKIRSKADFVRAYPSLAPREIVEKAKTEGVKFDVAYVYRIRAMDKTARKGKRAAARETISTTATVNGPASVTSVVARPSSSPEDLLRAVAAEIGLGRAVEILAGERARTRAVIEG
jgi:hypothetical protein